jgi:hypothetical protein
VHVQLTRGAVVALPLGARVPPRAACEQYACGPHARLHSHLARTRLLVDSLRAGREEPGYRERQNLALEYRGRKRRSPSAE